MTVKRHSQHEVGLAHLPNQTHKILMKKGTPLTIIVCGESGLGKTTFINTLFMTCIKDYKNPQKRHEKQFERTVDIEVTKAVLEEKRFKVNLNVIDTPGFGDYINNHNSWTPIVEFIDDQHEAYMRQEQQPTRQESTDTRVHVCLYFIRPTGHSLKPLDIETMKHLGSRVNLIPVIAKADTLSSNDLEQFKKNILSVIEAQNIQVYSCPVESDDEQTVQRNRDMVDAMPYSVIGSTEMVTTPEGHTVRGRAYTWGVAEVENDSHCDFKKLRNVLIRTHMLDLITTTQQVHYENYREQQMATRKFGEVKVKKYENHKHREKEDALRKVFTEQVRQEETRFRQWEQQLINERDHLNEDLEAQHAQIKTLEAQLDQIYQQHQGRATINR
ncbi:Septin-domain-containing protein [Spinellus fusiger]|nr:Septin-domain-containing protein [Spinellus fusiger]